MKNKREKTKKPTGVTVMLILYAILIAIFSLPLILTLVVIVLPSTNPFKEGFMLAAGGNMNDVFCVLGMIIYHFTLPILTVLCILKKKFRKLNACLIFGILISCQSPFHFIPAVISLIILYTNKSTKRYIKNEPAVQ